jgi:hypothetical protein
LGAATSVLSAAAGAHGAVADRAVGLALPAHAPASAANVIIATNDHRRIIVIGRSPPYRFSGRSSAAAVALVVYT